MVGQRVLAVRRRGKYLLLDLEHGLLLLHLGMSGSVMFSAHLGPAGKHDHFSLHTSQGVLRLNDPRRFGAVVFAPNEHSPQAQKLLGKLGGVEEAEEREPKGKRTTIKYIVLLHGLKCWAFRKTFGIISTFSTVDKLTKFVD